MKEDNPGVYIPPPIIFAGIFIAGWLVQKIISINPSFFQRSGLPVAGIIFLLISLFFLTSGVWRFLKAGTTLITVHRASSLQVAGIYRFSRNPMYLGLIFLYLALTCAIGNWWHIIFLPVLVIVMTRYVIRREEKYLEREFGDKYQEYKRKVRRWL